jgi:hypothetical protein
VTAIGVSEWQGIDRELTRDETVPTAAIASNLALGVDMVDAVQKSCSYVDAGIRTAPGLGKGNGPINHFHSLYRLPFAPYVSARPDHLPPLFPPTLRKMPRH